MPDKRHIEIKERILKFAMELWGINEPRNMDPVVDLLLDVFANETARLYQEIKASDSRLLYQLSRILIDNKWVLPIPAHALMSVAPNNDETCVLNAEDHFYTEKFIFGKESVQVFFTPLFNYPLVNARLGIIAYGDTVKTVSEKSFSSSLFLDRKEQIESYVVWLGFDINEKHLSETQEMTLCLIPDDTLFVPFLHMTRIYNCTGKEIPVQFGLKVQDPFNNAHYFDGITNFYNDYYVKISLTDADKSLKTLLQQFPLARQTENIDTDKKFFWIKLRLPEIFNSQDYLNSLNIYLNTYPVVNRKLVYKQHNFATNGRYIPLPCPKGSYFLNIRSICDNTGKEYTDRQQQYEENPTGIFDLYFGNLERFDSDSAIDLINQIIQRIREDGNAFSALNPDLLTAQLKELFFKLSEIEKSVENVNRDEKRQRIFALTVPAPNATSAEVKFWTTSGQLANGLDERAFVQQFNMEKYDATSLVFRTPVQGGIVHTEESNLVHSLRYGLVSRDRIVSKRDIHNYIYHKMGNNVDTIQIKDGIAISPERKKGFVRIVQVEIKLKQNIRDFLDLSVFAHFLEKDMTEKSVCNSSYKIVFL
ncbi:MULTISPECIES: type VI secretion system baseplate subunit TssF [Bacteroidaceae]|uniref:type VI secretion system baseplate subunit TssF n=1 Tax=Bacteroidaceae TaxID=815 RepID=UPI001F164A27|nr:MULTISPECIES: type VI secretion system baseplate subunit TssF [Bacteroidaceae]MCE8841099.1 type VI secretion system baseplate subunit TssF [Bacteroides thetaiotaomicron]MCE8861326.1 type VI secretion system baseplate subunit TssF [Phocaeicola vulgatus]